MAKTARFFTLAILNLGSLGVFAEPFDRPNVSPSATAAMVIEHDLQQTRQVQEALESIPHLSEVSKNIAISYLNGIIILQGSVASEQEAEVIYDIARSQTSLPIDNQLTMPE